MLLIDLLLELVNQPDSAFYELPTYYSVQKVLQDVLLMVYFLYLCCIVPVVCGLTFMLGFCYFLNFSEIISVSFSCFKKHKETSCV